MKFEKEAHPICLWVTIKVNKTLNNKTILFMD